MNILVLLATAGMLQQSDSLLALSAARGRDFAQLNPIPGARTFPAAQQQYRLSYNALTRQYRIGVGSLYQNFGALADALAFMSRVRRHEEIDPGALTKDTAYTAALRLRLDVSQMPKPFQLSALGSREWNVSSDWYRWTVTP